MRAARQSARALRPQPALQRLADSQPENEIYGGLGGLLFFPLFFSVGFGWFIDRCSARSEFDERLARKVLAAWHLRKRAKSSRSRSASPNWVPELDELVGHRRLPRCSRCKACCRCACSPCGCLSTWALMAAFALVLVHVIISNVFDGQMCHNPNSWRFAGLTGETSWAPMHDPAFLRLLKADGADTVVRLSSTLSFRTVDGCAPPAELVQTALAGYVRRMVPGRAFSLTSRNREADATAPECNASVPHAFDFAVDVDRAEEYAAAEVLQADLRQGAADRSSFEARFVEQSATSLHPLVQPGSLVVRAPSAAGGEDLAVDGPYCGNPAISDNRDSWLCPFHVCLSWPGNGLSFERLVIPVLKSAITLPEHPQADDGCEYLCKGEYVTPDGGWLWTGSASELRMSNVDTQNRTRGTTHVERCQKGLGCLVKAPSTQGGLIERQIVTDDDGLLQLLLPERLYSMVSPHLPSWVHGASPPDANLNWTLPVDQSHGNLGVAQHKVTHDMFLRSPSLFPLKDHRNSRYQYLILSHTIPYYPILSHTISYYLILSQLGPYSR
eukprot:SAG31_NODE_1356_length_8657_cov_4.678546_4_plen_556_part_00